MWAEVKGQRFSEHELEKALELACATGYPVLLLQGPPDRCAYFAIHPFDDFDPDCPSQYYTEYITSDRVALVMDYDPFGGDRYHLSEHRFYGCTGLSPSGPFPAPMPWTYHDQEIPKAIAAARGARFEFGESGSA
jgi:hypothetical protein